MQIDFEKNFDFFSFFRLFLDFLPFFGSSTVCDRNTQKKGSSTVCDRNTQKNRKSRKTELKKTGVVTVV